MALYKGSIKTGSFYLGSTKIGKLYKGSTLVYQSGPSIKLYGWKQTSGGSNYYYYTNKLGTTQNNIGLSGSNTGNVKFLGMNSGTLGTTGSTIRTTTMASSTYYKTINLNGINVYLYYDPGSGFISFPTVSAVIDNAEINSLVLDTLVLNINDYPLTVSAITDSTATFTVGSSSTTANRDSSLDFIWTNKAIS